MQLLPSGEQSGRATAGQRQWPAPPTTRRSSVRFAAAIRSRDRAKARCLVRCGSTFDPVEYALDRTALIHASTPSSVVARFRERDSRVAVYTRSSACPNEEIQKTSIAHRPPQPLRRARSFCRWLPARSCASRSPASAASSSRSPIAPFAVEGAAIAGRRLHRARRPGAQRPVSHRRCRHAADRRHRARQSCRLEDRAAPMRWSSAVCGDWPTAAMTCASVCSIPSSRRSSTGFRMSRRPATCG